MLLLFGLPLGCVAIGLALLVSAARSDSPDAPTMRAIGFGMLALGGVVVLLGLGALVFGFGVGF